MIPIIIFLIYKYYTPKFEQVNQFFLFAIHSQVFARNANK